MGNTFLRNVLCSFFYSNTFLIYPVQKNLFGFVILYYSFFVSIFCKKKVVGGFENRVTIDLMEVYFIFIFNERECWKWQKLRIVS